MSGADAVPKPKFPFPAKNSDENLKNVPTALLEFGQGPFEPLNGYLEKPGLVVNLTEHLLLQIPTPEFMPDVTMVTREDSFDGVQSTGAGVMSEGGVMLVENSADREQYQEGGISGYDVSHLIFMMVGVVAGMVVVSAISSIKTEKDDAYRALDF